MVWIHNASLWQMKGALFNLSLARCYDEEKALCMSATYNVILMALFDQALFDQVFLNPLSCQVLSQLVSR